MRLQHVEQLQSSPTFEGVPAHYSQAISNTLEAEGYKMFVVACKPL
jgi:hypothetical protein